jgi:hypothetical protein
VALNGAPTQDYSAARAALTLVGVQLLGSAVWPAPSGAPDRPDGVYQLLDFQEHLFRELRQAGASTSVVHQPTRTSVNNHETFSERT